MKDEKESCNKRRHPDLDKTSLAGESSNQSLGISRLQSVNAKHSMWS